MKPILFNTEMVQAILNGRKTATRRVIRDKDITNNFDIDVGGAAIAYIDQATGDSYLPQEVAPYKTGDVLWVRETWCRLYDLDNNDQPIEGTGQYYYRADGINPTPYTRFPDSDGLNGYRDGPRWRPSIHMPKKAARIFLEVTGVRVERLQDIKSRDAEAEGVGKLALNRWRDYSKTEKGFMNPVASFVTLWDSINAKRGYGWKSNPWVWVIEFKRVEV